MPDTWDSPMTCNGCGKALDERKAHYLSNEPDAPLCKSCYADIRSEMHASRRDDIDPRQR